MKRIPKSALCLLFALSLNLLIADAGEAGSPAFRAGVEATLQNEPDYAEAAASFRKAAQSGSPEGCYGLGLLYQHGLGIQEDHMKSREFLERAANLGLGRAWFELGLLAMTNTPEPDIASAEAHFKKAIDLGETRAWFGIATLLIKFDPKNRRALESGRDDLVDFTSAYEFLLKAAEVGEGRAFLLLCTLCLNGVGGVEQNVEKAIAYAEQAVSCGEVFMGNTILSNYYERLGKTDEAAACAAEADNTDILGDRIRIDLKL